MRALYVFGGHSYYTSNRWLSANLLRQGLEPTLDLTLPWPYYTRDQNYRNIMRISPDQTKAIGDTYRNAWYIPDIRTGETFALTTIYSGDIHSSFCGNRFYGFVGNSTKISVFDWETNSVQTIDKTGLGSTVWNCALSPDESKLAVIHSSSPYLRIYNTSDWSYYEPTWASDSSQSGIAWSPDGEWLLCGSSSSTYALYKFDKTLQNRVSISTSSTDTSSRPQSNYGFYALPHPFKNSSIIVAPNGSSSSSYRKLYEINMDTDEIIDILPRNIANYVFGFDIDLVERKLYFTCSGFTGSGAYATNRMIGAVDMDTYELKDFQNLGRFSMYGDSQIYCAVVNLDYSILTGTVRDIDNNPASRKVRAFRRTDGLLVGETMSDPLTGDYSLILPDQNTEAYDIQFMANEGEILNDLFFARATPQPVVV